MKRGSFLMLVESDHYPEIRRRFFHPDQNLSAELAGAAIYMDPRGGFVVLRSGYGPAPGYWVPTLREAEKLAGTN